MPSSSVTSEALAKKLQDFYRALNTDEQVALRDLLGTAYRGFSGAVVQPLGSKGDPTIDRLNDALAQARREIGADATAKIGPTITTVTITTVAASHPTITCN